MKKVFTIVATAVAVTVAMALPAAASAAPAVTMPAGTLVATGTALTGTGGSSQVTNGLKVETSLGLLKCTSVMLSGTLTTNSGTHVHGSGGTGSTTSGCTLNGKAATVSEINVISIDSTSAGSGTFETSFKAEVPGGVTCSFTNAGEPGAFSYTVGSSTGTVASTEMFSAACGESFLSGEVKGETSNGEAIILD